MGKIVRKIIGIVFIIIAVVMAFGFIIGFIGSIQDPDGWDFSGSWRIDGPFDIIFYGGLTVFVFLSIGIILFFAGKGGKDK